jgi:hypothetical protein
MPTFLSDPSQSLYLLLAVAFIGSAAAWYLTRKKNARHALLASGLLLLGLILLDVFWESPREQSNRKVLDMMTAATDRNRDRFVSHLAADFNYRGVDREGMKNSRVWDVIRQFDARVAAWGFGTNDFQQISDTEIEIGFYCKGESRTHAGFVHRFVRARFIREADGEYRMKSLKFFSPEGGLNREDTVPGFP